MVLADLFSARPKFLWQHNLALNMELVKSAHAHAKNIWAISVYMEWSGLYHRSSCESFKFRFSSPTLPENAALSCELGEFAPIAPLSHSPVLSSSLLMISACFTVVPTPDLCSLWKCEFKVSWIWVFSCQGSLCIVSCLLSCFKEGQIVAGRWIGRRIVFTRFSGTG